MTDIQQPSKPTESFNSPMSETKRTAKTSAIVISKSPARQIRLKVKAVAELVTETRNRR